MDGLADAHIKFLYILTGENLSFPPQGLVEKAQVGTIVYYGRDLLFVHTGVVGYVEQTVGIHEHVAPFNTENLVYDEMVHAPAFHAELVF